jgi:hypothetical protein
MSDHHVPLDGGWSIWNVSAVRGAGMPFDLLDGFAVPDVLDRERGEGRQDAIRDAASSAVRRVLRDDAVLAALAWQRPEILRTWALDYVAARDRDERQSTGRRNQREAVVARYAQRYCAKNESIGFFGSVAWARTALDRPGLTAEGSGGIRRMSVHFEVKAMEAVAGAWNRDPRLSPFLPVRLDPSAYFDGFRIYPSCRPPIDLDELSRALLHSLGGVCPAGELARRAGAETGTGPERAAERLWDLRSRGLVRIGFVVPCDSRPEARLRDQITEITDAAARAELLGELAMLEEARDALLAVATSARDILGAMEHLDGLLAQVVRKHEGDGATAASTVRAPRMPVYLDCRRDLDVSLGGDLIDRLRRPLSLVLDSARWLASEVGDAIHGELVARYRGLSARHAEVRLGDLKFAAGDLLNDRHEVVAEVADDFQLRWAEIAPADGAGEVRLTAEETAPLIKALFPAGPPRWAAARQHSPDIMLCLGPQGAPRWVLGELHLALNTLESRFFPEQADRRADLVEATTADMDRGRLVPVYPNSAGYVDSRTYPPLSLIPQGLYTHWSFAADEGPAERTAAVPAARLLVSLRDGELIATDVRDGWHAPVLEFFGEFLTAAVVNLFAIRRRDGPVRSPRLVLDDLVICRETWRFAASEVPVPASRPADYGHDRLRGWAREHRIPRRVFAKTPAEPKPFYVDFDAPLLVDNLARAVRRARSTRNEGSADPRLELVEMLPDAPDLWLTDEHGHRYTTEFRMVAVDGRRGRPVITHQERNPDGSH